MTRTDIIANGLMVAAFSTLAAGFCFDIKWTATAIGLVVISAVAMFITVLAWLNDPGAPKRP